MPAACSSRCAAPRGIAPRHSARTRSTSPATWRGQSLCSPDSSPFVRAFIRATRSRPWPLVRDVHDIAIYRHGEKLSLSVHLKLDADVPLATAHEVAERVEDALRSEPRVDDVHTHLEPLERPLIVRDEGRPSDEAE